MAVTFSGSSVSALASDIIQSAAYEIGVWSPGEAVPLGEQTWVLEKLQRIIDQWNAARELIFASSFTLYTIPANTSPITIGPTGDLNTGPAAQYRPVEIPSASFVLNPGTSNPVDLPIRMRTNDWWAANPLKSMTNSIITDLYYSADLPNGSLFFYPTCNVGAAVRLEQWSSLAQAVTLATQLGFVQGYWEALILDLALSLCPGFEKQPSAVLVQRRQQAMKIILGNNDKPPIIDTSSGMPGTRGDGRPDFNFLTGERS